VTKIWVPTVEHLNKLVRYSTRRYRQWWTNCD